MIRRMVVMLAVAMLFLAADVRAQCRNSMLNPITDVYWAGMFPMRIGGAQFGGGDGTAPGETDAPLCACLEPGGALVRMGVSFAFWEHARLEESVKDPYCFPSLGTGLGGGGGLNALMSGYQTTTGIDKGNSAAFQQVHYYIFPVWVLLNLFGDMPCIEKRPFDIAYMSEVDPAWNDDSLAALLNPEALLFGNPITQLSCMADSAAATAGYPLDPLFWCLGSWGSSYPLTGNTTDGNGDPVSYNAQLAARMIFKLGREGLLWDTAIDKCATEGVLSPIMVKSHYKLQMAKPVRGHNVPIGQPSFIWGAGKNPPMGTTSNAPDNFLWVLTRARTCCMGVGATSVLP